MPEDTWEARAYLGFHLQQELTARICRVDDNIGHGTVRAQSVSVMRRQLNKLLLSSAAIRRTPEERPPNR